jgi:hypothetical protein
VLFRASAAALIELARDPRFLGAQIGLLGVLQTWTRDLRFHPHIHYLAPGGGLAEDGRRWVTAKADFLVQVKPLAALFRAKLRAALRQTALWAEIPAAAWQQPWVVDCRPVGTARTALKYLAAYIFRVALSNNRIVRVAHAQVTFGYTVGATGQTAYCTLPVHSSCVGLCSTSSPRVSSRCAIRGCSALGCAAAWRACAASCSCSSTSPIK